MLNAPVPYVSDIEGTVRGKGDTPIGVSVFTDEVELPVSGARNAPSLDKSAVRRKDLELTVAAVRNPEIAIGSDGEESASGNVERHRPALGLPEKLDRAGIRA